MQTSIYAFDGGDACESLTHDSLSRPIGRIGRIVPKRLDMLLTEPEIAAATFDHQSLIPIAMTARRRTFRGNEQGRNLLHRDALFPAGAGADLDHPAQFADCMPQDMCQRPAKGLSGAARGWCALRKRCCNERAAGDGAGDGTASGRHAFGDAATGAGWTGWTGCGYTAARHPRAAQRRD